MIARAYRRAISVALIVIIVISLWKDRAIEGLALPQAHVGAGVVNVIPIKPLSLGTYIKHGGDTREVIVVFKVTDEAGPLAEGEGGTEYEYALGEKGTDSCPDGHEKILKEGDAEKAAESLGFEYKGAGSYNQATAGALYNTAGVYLNTEGKGGTDKMHQSVCRRPRKPTVLTAHMIPLNHHITNKFETFSYKSAEQYQYNADGAELWVVSPANNVTVVMTKPTVAFKPPVKVGKYNMKKLRDDNRTIELVAVDITDYGWTVTFDDRRYLIERSDPSTGPGSYDLHPYDSWNQMCSQTGVKAVFVPFNGSAKVTLRPVLDATDSGSRYTEAKRELARAEDDNATSKRLYEDTANHFVADVVRVSIMAFCALCMAAAIMNLETIKKTFIQNIASRSRRYETLFA